MVIAKFVYLLQELFGVPTNLQFEKHNFGPYNPAIKKAIKASAFGKDKFFTVRGSGENQVYALGQNSHKLFEYKKTLLNHAETAMKELNKEIGHFPSEKIELLATICKIIKDSQTTDLNIIQKEMKNWKTDKRNKENKAEIFDKEAVTKCLEYIKSQGWDCKLLKSKDYAHTAFTGEL